MELLEVAAEHEKLLQARQSAVDRFNGLTREEHRYEFSEASVSSRIFGKEQVQLIVGVFAITFVLVLLLSMVRSRAAM